MRVYFIGAGPGAADLITVRGAKILARVPMVLYAGSLVSEEVLLHCRPNALMINTAALNLDEQEAHFKNAQAQNWDVARLHSGDPSIYGATAEQMQRLDQLGIGYEVVPGVSSFVAAAAVLNAELTKPNIAQTIILTRAAGRASPLPEREKLESLAAHQTTLCIFLSGAKLAQVVAELLIHYPPETPVALVQKASWPQEKSYRGTLGTVLEQIAHDAWSLSTMLLVGQALNPGIVSQSRLYAPEYSHRFRKGSHGAVKR